MKGMKNSLNQKSRMDAMSEIIATINKSDRDDIRVSLSDFKGKRYIDIRLFVETEKEEERIPTKKGVTFSVDLYPEFRKAVEMLEATLLRKGLIDKEDSG